MEQSSLSDRVSKRPFYIPVYLWVLGAGLAAALAAVLVFEVPATTAGTVFLGVLVIGALFFLQPGRGQQGERPRQEVNPNWQILDESLKDENNPPKGCCH